jgi:hypothetical protein
MLKLLKKITTAANFSNKNTHQVIEEIHQSFYTEVDRLLASAKIAQTIDTDKQYLLDKCTRLKALGFTKTKEIIEAENEIAQLELIKKENLAKEKLINAINYFSFKYPAYRFITQDSVRAICAKYNLIFGTVDKYLGTVPEKNLKQIEEFKIADEDQCYSRVVLVGGPFGFMPVPALTGFISKTELFITDDDLKKAGFSPNFRKMDFREQKTKCELEIVAPATDFNLKGMDVKNHQIINKKPIPDPVVLKPVAYKNEKYYLIVTAWGLEAADELVVNPKNN